jgi:hypothetical protein
LSLIGDSMPVKVSASDVANQAKCGRYLALKTHPGIKGVNRWQRLFAPWAQAAPFPLRDVIELVIDAHREDFRGDYKAFDNWLRSSIEERSIHRLVRPYVRHAVENVLDAHEAIEGEIGPLTLLALNPQVGPADRLLSVWGPLYTTENGIREIRRFRLDTVQDRDEEDRQLWTAAAAFVAAAYPRGIPPTHIRVAEIGAADGSIQVTFNDSPEMARAAFASAGRRRAAAIPEEDHVVPCRSCGECKAAGACTALTNVDSMLGQTGRGHSSRSISPGELERYLRCPGQWLLDSCLHLPREHFGGDGAARGYAVHRWLAAAHARRTACSPADLPAPGTGLGLAEGILTETDYQVAYPFLSQHIAQCPLSDPDVQVEAVEEDIYGYDHLAEVVPVTRPDLMYRVGNRLVIREVKTASAAYESGRAEAYDKHLQIPFLLTMLNSGLLGAYGATAGTVELELLTSTEGFLWSWDAADPAVAGVAAGSVRRSVEAWHTDATWDTRPSPLCAWCPVRRWCPDRDVWQERETASESAPSAAASPSEEEPPF